MKTCKILFWLGLGILPFLAGCPQKRTVVTTVNSNGSIERSIGKIDPRKFEGIDSVIHKMPIPVDSGWKLETINDSTAVLRGHYHSADELNAAYKNDKSALQQCKRHVLLDKEFRWFFTIFKYSEIFSGILTDIPLNHYLLEEEIKALKSNNSEAFLEAKHLVKKARTSLSDNIDERLGFWLSDQLYFMAFDDIMRVADSLQLLAGLEYNYGEVKDSVNHRLDIEHKNLVLFDEGDEMKSDELVRYIGSYLDLDSMNIDLLRKAVSEMDLETKYEDKIFFGATDDYHNYLIMPGQLIDTNAEEVRGDTLKWDLTFLKFIDDDFTVYAESKVTNIWAYVVSGIIVIVAIFLLFGARRN